MPVFRPPADLLISETKHWLINHRVDTTLPGYLMLGSTADTNDLGDLPPEALAELGGHLAVLQRILTELLSPVHFYMGRYGHSTAHAIHFHIMPVQAWVAEAFARDSRYRALEQFEVAGAGEGNDAMYDGAEMTLFIWREFCESPTPPGIHGLSIPDIVARVRERLDRS